MASDNETLEEKQAGEEHEDVEVKEKAEVDEGVGNEEKEEKGSGNEEEEEKGSGNDVEEGNGSDNVEVKDEKDGMEVDNKSEEKEKLEGEKKGSTRKRKERKKEKEKASPVTPAIDRPTRERKIVERYTETSAARSATPKPFSIEKGRGTALKDIPNVAFMLSKRKSDDNMQMLHNILFGRKTKAHMLKRNIGMFSGFAWAESEEDKQRGKLKEKLDKCVKEKLFYFCDVLNIPIHKGVTRKEELSAKLLEFLKSPHATTDALLADKEKGKKQKEKASASKTTGSSDTASGKSAKENITGKKSSNVDLFLIGYKKENPKTGKRDQWVESSAEATYSCFQSLAVEESLAQREATDDSTARTKNFPHSDDELFSQVVGGVYKDRVYEMGNQPSTFMSQVQYDLMCHRVAELTEELNNCRQQLTEELNNCRQQLTEKYNNWEQQLIEKHNNLQQQQFRQMMELFQSLQSKMKKMKKRSKKKKKQRNNENIDSSMDMDNN